MLVYSIVSMHNSSPVAVFWTPLHEGIIIGQVLN